MFCRAPTTPVRLQGTLSDRYLSRARSPHQRYLEIAVDVQDDPDGEAVPISLCLLIDCSASMTGAALQQVQTAAKNLVLALRDGDHLSIVAFADRARSVVVNQTVTGDRSGLLLDIDRLHARGGTAIDDGLILAIESLALSPLHSIPSLVLLTDGDNEHGDDDRCRQLALLAANYGVIIHCLGLGDRWNADLLEAIADAGSGSATHLEDSTAVTATFAALLRRLQTVRLTNAKLHVSLAPGVRLATYRPAAQVAPDVVELVVQRGDDEALCLRLGDVAIAQPRTVLLALYIALPPEDQPEDLGGGDCAVAQVWVSYDDPRAGWSQLRSEPVSVTAAIATPEHSAPNPSVRSSLLALARYRQVRLAEGRLVAGDLSGAATLYQVAANTAIQLDCHDMVTSIQYMATTLQGGQLPSPRDRLCTRLAVKHTSGDLLLPLRGAGETLEGPV